MRGDFCCLSLTIFSRRMGCKTHWCPLALAWPWSPVFPEIGYTQAPNVINRHKKNNTLFLAMVFKEVHYPCASAAADRDFLLYLPTMLTLVSRPFASCSQWTHYWCVNVSAHAIGSPMKASNLFIGCWRWVARRRCIPLRRVYVVLLSIAALSAPDP